MLLIKSISGFQWRWQDIGSIKDLRGLRNCPFSQVAGKINEVTGNSTGLRAQRVVAAEEMLATISSTDGTSDHPFPPLIAWVTAGITCNPLSGFPDTLSRGEAGNSQGHSSLHQREANKLWQDAQKGERFFPSDAHRVHFISLSITNHLRHIFIDSNLPID